MRTSNVLVRIKLHSESEQISKHLKARKSKVAGELKAERMTAIMIESQAGLGITQKAGSKEKIAAA